MMTGPTTLPATEAAKINADPLSFIQAKSSKEAVAAATLCRFHQLAFACNPLMRLVTASDLIFKLAIMLWQSFGDDVLTSRDVPGSRGS